MSARTNSSGPLRPRKWSTPVAAGIAAASLNVAAMQADLNAGRGVAISAPGAYYIDASLVVPSGGSVTLGPGVELVAVGSTCFPAIVNANFSAAPVSISSITATKVAYRGIRLTVVFSAAHNMAVDGFVLIKGDTTETVNGCWPIESIVNPTTLTILSGWPSPPTGYTFPTIAGALTGVKADADIYVGGGGAINMNFLGGGFTAAGDWHDHAIALNNVLRPTIERLRVLDARKYGIMLSNVDHGRVRSIEGRSGSDGVHVYGPAWHPIVEDITGEFGDDACTYQTIDGPGYVQYQGPNSGGNFYGGVMRNIFPRWTDNAGSAVMYPSGGSSAQLGYKFIGKFIIDGAGRDLHSTSGFSSGAAVSIGAGYCPFDSSIESLEIRSVASSSVNISNAGGAGVITIEQLVLDGYVNDIAPDNQVAGFSFSKVDIKSFLVRGLRIQNGSGTTGTNIFDLLDATAIIRSLVIEGARVGGGSGMLINSTGGRLESATIIGLHLTDGYAIVKGGATFANVPAVAVIGGCISVTSSAFQSAGTQVVNYSVHGLNLAGGALVNFYGTASTVFRCTGLLNTGGGATALNMSSNCYWYNPDGSAPLNITTLRRTVNAIAAHSGDGNHLYVCDNTGSAGSWKKMVNPATTV
ncbi:MAG: hypothetical protein IAE86_06945 [Burkholderiaceae bacterium]|nr:hypothetical protein [Burkholderiaceae bacterium]